MSMRLYVHHIDQDRPATTEEIENLFLNCLNEGTGLADLDMRLPNGTCKDPGGDFTIQVLQIA